MLDLNTEIYLEVPKESFKSSTSGHQKKTPTLRSPARKYGKSGGHRIRVYGKSQPFGNKNKKNTSILRKNKNLEAF